MTVLELIRKWMRDCPDLNREVKVQILTRGENQEVVAKDFAPVAHIHSHSGTICIESAEIAKLDESEWYK